MNNAFIQRKHRILQLLEEKGTIRVTELAQEFGISEITIRRDLDKIEKEGLLLKIHGGASKREHSFSEMLYEKSAKTLATEKKRIGMEAARMVKPGDVIFMDTGTTTLQVAAALKKSKDITIITNSILILTELRLVKNVSLIILGGNYRVGNFALSGPLTETDVESFRAKYAFLGADGVLSSGSVTSNDIYTAHITKLMLKYSEKPVLVTDHTKIGRSGSIKYANIEDFDTIITDDQLDSQNASFLEGRDINIRRV